MRIIGLLFEMISTVFHLYSYEYVFKHIFGELRGNAAEIFSNRKLVNATLHIDGQSTVVDAPPDIIDVPDEYDDIIDDEDALPHDLADSDVEDLINVDDDGVAKVYSSEEED
jgi:hypothetical protein